MSLNIEVQRNNIQGEVENIAIHRLEGFWI